MLRELRIRNYAVIDDVQLELAPGLNVLTGETGAGKSIIVGALSLLLGERASSDDVREGEDRAVVEAAFDVSGQEAVLDRCRQAGVEPEEGWLILRREVQREGRNRAWVNGSPATASLTWELGSGLVELHGQHEHQALLRTSEQRTILDAYAGARELVEEVARLHGEVQEKQEEIRRLRQQARESRERADYLRFKAQEIEEADLTPGEEGELKSEARRLEHSEELLSLSGGLHEAIYGGEGSVVERLGELRASLRELVDIDAEADDFVELYESARAELEELGRRLASYHQEVDHDPGRLEAIRSRLEEIYDLQRKYGETVDEVVRAGRRAREELEALEHSDERIERLEEEVTALREEMEEWAGRLTEAREGAAEELEAEIEPLLAQLGMEEGRFQVELSPLPEVRSRGAEEVEFLVSLNPGFEPGPLKRIASGGELSRVMLALKTVLAQVDRIPSLVFDEIDAGIGGQVAHRVAEKLAAVAGRHQVFVITHLPQIAARAEAHYRVEKRPVEGRAATRVSRLQEEPRVEEVARMLGGDPESGLSRRHARELLEGDQAAG